MLDVGDGSLMRPPLLINDIMVNGISDNVLEDEFGGQIKLLNYFIPSSISLSIFPFNTSTNFNVGLVLKEVDSISKAKVEAEEEKK